MLPHDFQERLAKAVEAHAHLSAAERAELSRWIWERIGQAPLTPTELAQFLDWLSSTQPRLVPHAAEQPMTQCHKESLPNVRTNRFGNDVPFRESRSATAEGPFTTTSGRLQTTEETRVHEEGEEPMAAKEFADWLHLKVLGNGSLSAKEKKEFASFLLDRLRSNDTLSKKEKLVYGTASRLLARILGNPKGSDEESA